MKIDIIGTGNVGSHLFNSLKDKADVKLVSSRLFEGLRNDSDLHIIAVSDNAIRSVATELCNKINKNGIVAHTSGTVSIDEIANIHGHTGVIYPLQTFSKDVPLNYKEIPFFIESSDKETDKVLQDVVKLIGSSFRHIDSQERKKIHIASVFACNFVNHLWMLADTFLDDNNLCFDDLIPLIKETARKINAVKPYFAQTGPASRHDEKTVNEHLNILENNHELKKIYKLLSDSIEMHHPKNLNK